MQKFTVKKIAVLGAGVIEAFAAQSLAVIHTLGHPLGATSSSTAWR